MLDSDEMGSGRYPEWYLKTIGALGLVFGSIGLIFSLKKFFSKKMGLIIDNTGIESNDDALSLKIPWCDISHFTIYQVKSTKMACIHVYDTEKYLNEMTGWKRQLSKMNVNLCGRPFSVNATALSINFNELYTLLQQRHAKYLHTTKVA